MSQEELLEKPPPLAHNFMWFHARRFKTWLMLNDQLSPVALRMKLLEALQTLDRQSQNHKSKIENSYRPLNGCQMQQALKKQPKLDVEIDAL
ncbi:hypothetical protein [Thermoleptolyngbya sp. M55_K2018_002]|uniref:hypothetical protein n=1 Tax=Thermoleptolyngbya sp. M55_K2018_002 TaxID=2747808 RepID=UPI001A00B263|nr:hypothetical protein [Thermoleptolyngbya sp. M55_K2018_002]HIK40732.1 hypothetical protein [Thermoleptolyngbya sp. M55_K2018_002]